VEKITLSLGAMIIAVLSGCSDATEVGSEPPAAEPVSVEGPAPAILPTPFTADQIRDEWIRGFELRIRRWTAEAEAFEHWKVIAADDEGVDIESVSLTADGTPTGDPRVQHSSWTQLRDHASFPADRSKREETTRTTPLGELEGWLYTVEDPGTGVVSEFFFAHGLAGAPVFVHVIHDGEIVEIFEQIERSRS
jgi:hypothetical protein